MDYVRPMNSNEVDLIDLFLYIIKSTQNDAKLIPAWYKWSCVLFLDYHFAHFGFEKYPCEAFSSDGNLTLFVRSVSLI